MADPFGRIESLYQRRAARHPTNVARFSPRRAAVTNICVAKSSHCLASAQRPPAF